MRYQIRQKIFSFGDNFVIHDASGNEQYVVRGKVFSFGDKLKIEDLSGTELLYIEQQLFRFLPEYLIYKNGQIAAKVKKEFTFFTPKFKIESIFGNFTMEGDLFNYNFQILKDGNLIATVNKKWFAFADTYGVDIADQEDQAFMLALVIVIDQVLHDDNHNSH